MTFKLFTKIVRWQCDICGNIQEGEPGVSTEQLPKKLLCRSCIKQLFTFLKDNEIKVISL